MIEAFNKTVKYQWLYKKDLPNHEVLLKYLDEFIPIYNQLRPHCKLGGLTPDQAYTGVIAPKDQWKLDKYNARVKRILENQQLNCPFCPYGNSLPEFFI